MPSITDSMPNINNLYDNIPSQLRELKQWVLWKKEQKGKKWTKLPYQTTDKPASTTDSRTWREFKQVNTFLNNDTRGRYDGIGFVFTEGYVGLDMDHCFAPDGEMFPDFKMIVGMANTYTEKSQSGTGLHLIFKGHKNGERCKSKKMLHEGQTEGNESQYELYEKSRFFVMTGDIYGEAKPILENQDILNDISKLIFPVEREESQSDAEPREVFVLEDEKIIKMGLAEKSGLFKELFVDGTTDRYGNDDSSADGALCAKIVFYTQEKEQIERIFNRSKLAERDKWTSREDYRVRTIKSALDFVKEYYKPREKDRFDFDLDESSEPELVRIQKVLIKIEPHFLISKSGQIVNERENQKTGEITIHVMSNFVAWVSSDICTVIGGETKRKRLVDGFAEGKRLPQIEVMAEGFGRLDWVREKWGARVFIGAGRNTQDVVRAVIDIASQGAPEIIEKSHPGFEEVNGELVFITGGSVITQEGVQESIRTAMDVGMERFKLPGAIPTPEELCESIRFSLGLLNIAPKRVTWGILSITYLAPLVDLFNEMKHIPAFAGWLAGTTGYRKTALAAVFASHFGDFTGEGLPAGFLDTANDIERKMHQAKDVLLVIDDYSPQANPGEAEQMRKKAERVARGYGDRVGRGRLNSDSTGKKAYVPKGMGLVTGEFPLEGAVSSIARFVFMKLNSKEDVDVVKLTNAQKNREKLQTSMTGFIRFILRNREPFKADIKENFDDNRLAKGQMNMDVHGRSVDAFLYLELATRALLTYAYTSGAITAEEKEVYLNEAKVYLEEITRDQKSYADGETPVEKFMTTLNELIASGRVGIAAMDATGIVGDPRFQMIGWSDGTTVYLLPQLAYTEVTKSLATRKMVLGIPAKTLFTDLFRAGKIEGVEDVQGRINFYKQPRGLAYGSIETKRPRVITMSPGTIDTDFRSFIRTEGN